MPHSSFFLYTLLGSVLMLLAVLAMYYTAKTSDITQLLKFSFPPAMQTWLWLAFFASFAVKMPMWPVHTWLPDAHVEAPTAGSVILAAILLKMGGYGFIRFSLPMFPDASAYFAPLVYAFSIIAIIYTSLVAMVQEDVKKLIAYSPVAHMGFVTMGLFAMNAQGCKAPCSRWCRTASFPARSSFASAWSMIACIRARSQPRRPRPADAALAVAFMVFTWRMSACPARRASSANSCRWSARSAPILGSLFLRRSASFYLAAYALWLYARMISA